MYINSSKTKMYCILVFLNYHVQTRLWLCAFTPWVFVLQEVSKYFVSCDYTRVLAKSRSICPPSSYIITLSYSTQVSLWISPSYSHTRTTGSSLSLKDTSYLFVLRTPPSPSMPKSGNVCGRRYTKTKIQPWRPHHPTLSVLPNSSGPILNPTHS